MCMQRGEIMGGKKGQRGLVLDDEEEEGEEGELGSR